MFLTMEAKAVDNLDKKVVLEQSQLTLTDLEEGTTKALK
jgi:hypothetical protein